MIKISRLIITVWMWLSLAWLSVGPIVLRFSNPDMTETRLFLEFWWFIVAGVVSLGLCMWFLDMTEDDA